MQFADYIDDIARAAGFLSRLPMPARHFKDHDGSLSRAAGMFPVAGLLIALGPGLVAWLLTALEANAALTSLITLMLLIGLTGALHEDGLADSADAFGARGGREHMLAIMKDSRIGTYGVLALLVSFSLRAVSLTILIAATGGVNALLLLVAVAAMSRAAMVWHWGTLELARIDGIAAAVGAPDSTTSKRAILIGGTMFLLLASLATGLMTALISLGLAAAVAWQWTAAVRARLGGHTGDTIGATQQISETAALAALALLL